MGILFGWKMKNEPTRALRIRADTIFREKKRKIIENKEN